MADALTLNAPVNLDLRKATAQWKRFEATFARTGRNSPLGRITGDVRDFDKSLGAATNRVVAFGAAAAVFNTVQRTFTSFIAATVNVEQQLAKINVNLGESTDGLKQFSAQLFTVARQTGQTLEDAGKAAEELARQGLGAEETIKRLKDALILSRIAGINSAEAVDTLTAAINSFNKEALTSTEIVAKFAAVDTSFAVSSKDLAEAISRTGSTAQEAGIKIDELNALVASLQQTTSRGGATIGNALKTIFTRLTAAPETISALESIGVAIRDSSGNVRSAIDILKEYAVARDKLSESERNATDRAISGTQQINILKSAVADLSKEYSIYSRALNVSEQATDQAIRKNEELNKTIASLFNSAQVSVQQFFASLGSQDVNPILKGILGAFENIRSFFSGDSGSELGKSLGDGILKGLSNVLTGPGIFLLGRALANVFGKVTQTIGGDLRGILGLNSASQQRAIIQERINGLIRQATSAEQAQLATATSLLAQKKAILAISERIALSERVGTPLQNAFLSTTALGSTRIQKGLKPNFADSGINAAIKREKAAGVPTNQIYVDRDPRVANFANPLGLLVANKRDEPLGGFQGVNRVLAQGDNPKTAGMAPNFARKKTLLTQAEIVGKRFGIGDPRYDESIAAKVQAAKAVSSLDAALNRSETVNTILEQKAKKTSELLALVNKGFEGLSKQLQRAQGKSGYDQPIGPSFESFVASKIINSGSSAASPAAFAAYEAQRNASGGFDTQNNLIRAREFARQKAANAKPFGPAFPISPELQKRLQDADLARKGIQATTEFSSPIGPPDQVTFAREKILRQAELRGRLEALKKQKQLRDAQEAQARFEASQMRRQQEAARLQALKERREKRLNTTTLATAFAAPFAAGFIPEGRGGTGGGVFGGAASGALQGAGVGALLGPKGIVAGAAVGAFVGAVSKAKKSLEEFAAEFDAINTNNQKRVDSVTQITQAQSELTEALKSGASSNVIDRLTKNLNRLTESLDLDLSKKIKDAGGNLEKLGQIIDNLSDESQKTRGRTESAEILLTSLRSGRLGGFLGLSNTDVKKTDIDKFSRALTPEISKQIDRRFLFGIRNRIGDGSNLERGGNFNTEIISTNDIQKLNSQLELLKTIFPELADEAEVTVSNVKNVVNLLLEGSINSDKLRKIQESSQKETAARNTRIRLQSIPGNQNAFASGLFGIQRQGVNERAGINLSARSQLLGLTRTSSSLSDITAQADIDALRLSEKTTLSQISQDFIEELKKRAQGLELKPDLERQIGSTTDFNKLLELFSSNELAVSAQDLDDINRRKIAAETELAAKTNESIKTRLSAAQAEKTVAEAQRRANAFRGASLAGSEALNALGANLRRGIGSKTPALAAQQRLLIRQSDEELSGLDLPETDAQKRQRIINDAKSRLDAARKYAAGFLSSRTGGRYETGLGVSVNALSSGLRNLQGGQFDDATKRTAARLSSGIAQLEEDVKDPENLLKKLPNIKQSFDELTKLNSDQANLLSQTNDLYLKVSKMLSESNREIIASINGEIKLTSTTLSPETLKSLQDSLISSIQPIMEKRLKEIESKRDGKPLPPSQLSYSPNPLYTPR